MAQRQGDGVEDQIPLDPQLFTSIALSPEPLHLVVIVIQRIRPISIHMQILCVNEDDLSMASTWITHDTPPFSSAEVT